MTNQQQKNKTKKIKKQAIFLLSVLLDLIVLYNIIFMLHIKPKQTKYLFKKIIQSIVIDLMKTPNPNFLKFIPIGQKVLQQQGTLDISSKKFSQISPLAQQLFKINGVTRVFYANDYLSVAKSQQSNWDLLKPQIFKAINQHYQKKLPLLIDNVTIQTDQIDPNDSEVVQFIKQIIASRIRPNVQQDGGDVKFVSFDEQSGILKVRLAGACSGCPSSSATLKGGIQKMLTYYVKEIKQVIAQQDCSK